MVERIDRLDREMPLGGENEGFYDATEDIEAVLEGMLACPVCSSPRHIVYLDNSGRCQSCGYIPEYDSDSIDRTKIPHLSSDEPEIEDPFQRINVGVIKGVQSVSYRTFESGKLQDTEQKGIKSRKLVVDYVIEKMISHRTRKKTKSKIRVEYLVKEREQATFFFDGSERTPIKQDQIVSCDIQAVYRDMPSGFSKVETKSLFEGAFLAVNYAGKILAANILKNK